jgi:phage tail-like protein
MRAPAGLHIALGLCLSATLGLTTSGFSQAPTADNQPRLAAPTRGAAIQPATTVPDAATPLAPTPGQPTTAAASDPAATPNPTPVTQVSGPPAGVTQLPNSTATSTTASSSQAATAAYRGYSASRFSLALEGIQAGSLNAVEGGTPTADVVSEKAGSDNVTHKHVGGVKYEELSFTTGLDSKPVTDWITATLKGQRLPKNGTVIAADYDGNAVSQLDFFNGRVSGISFPALDAASKDAATLTVSVTPEYTQPKTGSGKVSVASASKTQKRWSAMNFRFEMAGLDGSRVNHIDAISIGSKPEEIPVGEQRDYEKTTAALVVPNVTLTLAQAYAGTWATWLDDFLVKGNNSDDKERSGSIVYLDQTLKAELGRLNLFNCGIVRLAPVKAQAGRETIQRVQAELYCERMEFEAKAAIN